MDFPAEELRARREELGLRREDVSAMIHVPPGFIEAIERGDLRRLPAPCYATSFLQSYCRHLGLDSERYVDALRAALLPAHPRLLTMKGPRPQIQLASAPAWLHNLLAWAAVVLVFAAAWLVYVVVFNPQARLGDGGVRAGTREMTLPPPPGIEASPYNTYRGRD